MMCGDGLVAPCWQGLARAVCWSCPFRGESSSSVSSSPKGGSSVVHPMTERQLCDAMTKVRKAAQSWESAEMEIIRHLQDAHRNKGCVQLVRDLSHGGEVFAVKRMPNSWVCVGHEEFDKTYPTANEKPWRDLGFVRHLNDIGFPYVCRLAGLFRSDAETFVASDFCTQGDLFSWVNSEHLPYPGPIREAVILPVTMQIFFGVRWLHDLGIAHRDISLENVLLTTGSDGNMQVRIIDFGMSTLSRFMRSETTGKASYQAPEMFAPEVEVDAFLVDVFALGVVVFAMAVQDYPWMSTRRDSCQLYEYAREYGLRKFMLRRKLRAGRGEPLAEVISPPLTDFLEELLRMSPHERACLGEACLVSRVLHMRRNAWDLEWLKRGLPKNGDGVSRGVTF